MSPEWQEHLKHAMKECERLGLEFSMITGPGWTGTGGPWIKAEESMQHLLTSPGRTSHPEWHSAHMEFTGTVPRPSGPC